MLTPVEAVQMDGTTLTVVDGHTAKKKGQHKRTKLGRVIVAHYLELGEEWWGKRWEYDLLNKKSSERCVYIYIQKAGSSSVNKDQALSEMVPNYHCGKRV